MAHGMIVRLPVSVSYGTDEEFDLRVRLEHELATALAATRVGECVGGGIDTTHLNLHLEGISDPPAALAVVKGVLDGAGVLDRTLVVLETLSPANPDDCDQQVLWPANYC